MFARSVLRRIVDRHQQRRRQRLCRLEWMEPRNMLAVIHVTTTNQEINSDANCSLQEAIYAANFDASKATDPTDLSQTIPTGCAPGNGDDTIVLEDGAVYSMAGFVQDPFNPAGMTANPVIASTITIEGHGATLERTGNLDVRAFVITTTGVDPNVGLAPFVDGDGNLTLRDLYIRDFKTKGGDGGEHGGGGGLGAGGAIYNVRGVLVVENSTFAGNTATGGAGGAGGAGHSAGSGGGGGGLTGDGGSGSAAAGGGGGARGAGGDGSNGGGGGGGTANDGAAGLSDGTGGAGGNRCGGKGGDDPGNNGKNGSCAGGGGGGAAGSQSGAGGVGGNGGYGGGGGGGGQHAAGGGNAGNGGNGGFGAGGGGGGSSVSGGGRGGNAGFGAGAGGGGGGNSGGGSAGTPSAFGGGYGVDGTTSEAGAGGNGAGMGGAIFNESGTLIIRNSTFFGNKAFGGADAPGIPTIFPRAGGDGVVFSRNGTTRIFNTTFSDSTSFSDLWVVADGAGATLELRNTILANNLSSQDFNCATTEVNGGNVNQSASGNLIEKNITSGGGSAACGGVVTTGDPGLQPLRLTAPGLTPTMAILETSPAFNAADGATSLATDQRGAARPQAGGYDIGAFELEAADVSLSKWASTNVVHAGEELFYNISIFNDGPGTAADVVVTDDLPPGLLFLGDTADTAIPGGCALSGSTLTCQLGNLRAGESSDFQIKVRVAADYVAIEADGTRTLSNTASVTTDSIDEHLSNNSSTEKIFVEDLADLRVSKVSKPDDTVRAGQDFVYTIYVENYGPSYARNVKFTDLMVSDQNFQIISITTDPTRADNCTLSTFVNTAVKSASITCSLTGALEPIDNEVVPPPVPNTGIWTIQVTARSAPINAPTNNSHPTQPYDIDNSVRVFTQAPSGTVGNSTPDPDLSNNQASDSITVVPVTDLQMFAVFGAEVQTAGLPGSSINTNLLPAMPDPACCNFGGTTVTAGRRIQWDTSALVGGPSGAENVRIEVLLPEGTSLIENTLTGTPNPGNAPGRCSTLPAGQHRTTVICDYGNLNVGQTASLRMQLLVDASLPVGTQLSIDSRASSDTLDPDENNNSASIQFDTNAFADLRIAKTDDPDPVLAGNQITYTLTTTNDGPSTAQNVQITDTTPAHTTFASLIASPGGSCVAPIVGGTGTITCTWEGATAPNASRTVTVRLLVDSATPDGTLLSNSAATSSLTTDPVTSDNSISGVTTTVHTEADLRIDKSSFQQKVIAGTQTKFVILVENLGPSDAQDVQVIDQLPDGVTYETDTDSCVEGPVGTLTCSLGIMKPGQQTTFDIWVFVDPNLPPYTTLTNTATVDSPTTDPDLSNNTDSSTILVLREDTDLQITKSAPATAELGTEITYTITVTNAGPIAAKDVVVKDFLPVGLRPQSYSPAVGNCLAGVVGDAQRPTQCNLGTLDVGATVTIEVDALVSNDLHDLTQLFNDALVSSSVKETHPEDNVVHSVTTAQQTANGNVTAVVRSGQLFITGDKFNNKVRIEAATPADPNALRIVPLGGTKVNGKFDSVQVHAARGISLISMADGNDTLIVAGPVSFTKRLSVGLGKGFDELDMTGAYVGGPAAITADGDDDVIKIVDSLFANSLSIRGGDGNDTVLLQDITVAGALDLGVDGGDDSVAIVDSTLNGTLNIRTGTGSDSVLIDTTKTFKSATVTNDGNNDVVRVVDSIFSGNVSFTGGSGFDTLDANPATNGNTFAKLPTIKKYESIL